jgi:hypothetical protein
VASAVARFRGENFGQPKFQNLMVASVPYVEPPKSLQTHISEKLDAVILRQKGLFSTSETCVEFVAIQNEIASPMLDRLDRSSLLGRELDLEIGAVFGLSESNMTILERDLMDSVNSPGWVSEADVESDSAEEPIDQQGPHDVVHSLASYSLGVAFGRWDVRFATGEKPAPELPDPFAPLPVCPPGQLQNEQGLPITREDVTWLKEEGRWHYPLEIPWDGILVDDPGHPLDLEARIHQVLQIIWQDRWEAIEHET